MSTSQLEDMTALILAGGKGTRIAALYPDIPKPMIPVKGHPFLYWIIQWIMRQGIRRVVISTGHMAEKIDDWVATKPFGDRVEIICRRETEPLGTGGGVRNCLDLLDEWTLVTNGDSLIDADIYELVDSLAISSVDAVIFGVSVDDTSRFGSLKVSPLGLLETFAEKVPGKGLINSGIYLLKQRLISSIPAGRTVSIEKETFPKMIQNETKIKIIKINSTKFVDIGTPDNF